MYKNNNRKLNKKQLLELPVRSMMSVTRLTKKSIVLHNDHVKITKHL